MNIAMKGTMGAKKNPTRILIVDDHPLLRKGVAQLINNEKDMVVCGEAEDAHKALTAIGTTKCDVAIIDVSLGGTSGIELLKNIKVHYPKLLVMVLSMHDESVYAQRALRAGAAGYIMKQEASEKVIAGLRKILSGEVYLSERLGNRMLNTLVGGRASLNGSPIEELSDRELEVFGLIGQGHGTRPIAEKLHLSVKTIESHRENIKQKLKVTSGAQLVKYAFHWVQSKEWPGAETAVRAAKPKRSRG
jgi:DNA-binding NarL/FixJ family response regulator